MSTRPSKRSSFLFVGLPFLTFMGLGSVWLSEILRGKQSLRNEQALHMKGTIKRTKFNLEQELAILQGKINIDAWENRAIPDFPGKRDPNRKPSD
ncbi:hypothetical protein T492DRAFT_1009485 [Pavlovales sp. CCMP2436]|nr:hypothetical protein T492DRAFT_1009485 [Pavlovales sp. CCMP2436]